MSETRACPECRGAAYLPTKGVDDHTGYEPCKVCQGTGRVWGVDLLRDADPCGACPDTLATCSAPTIKDEGRVRAINEKWAAIAEKLLEPVRESERITGEDLAIRINARDDDLWPRLGTE